VKVSAWTALGRYQPRLQRSWTKLIRAYKEAPAVGLARAFAAVTYEHLVLQGWFAQIDLIVPIPPNPVKFAKRGFAPTDLLAKELETACAIPSYPILDRTVPESDTQESDYADVLATYSAKPKWEGVVAGANVLLVEDIITKGKNINAGGTRLFELKAEGVFVVALALTQDS
jgi:predicted amidophosphoribosyltransferase